MKARLVWLLAGIWVVLGTLPAAADIIRCGIGVLSTSFSGGWGHYFADRFTNDAAGRLAIEAVLIRRTPSGGAAEMCFWADDNGSPGSSLGAPVFE